MNYYSLNHKAPNTSFKDAVIKGLAPDKGLYFPESITPLPKEFFDNIDNLTHSEIAFEAIKQFVLPEIPEDVLKTIVEETLAFDFPVVTLNENISTLELFHGPTMAFKDVGARFMARCLGYFNQENTSDVTVLVATSGDTGGAVANGFLGVKGVNVVILYPSGKVSDIQEKQLTTLGQNITALEVDGVFDDCQTLVKQAFLDADLDEKLLLTSANAINIARWIPQCLYYFYAFSRLPKAHKKVVFAVPSGNFGNIGAGILAQQMGLPIERFVAATNVNKVVPDFLKGEAFAAKPSIQTLSNSMDVGNPSNFPRLLSLYGGDGDKFRENVKGYFYTDERTLQAIQAVKSKGYTLDPHGAVGYLGLKDFMEENPDYAGVFLETAHPGKFRDVVEEALGEKVDLPERLAAFLDGQKSVIPMGRSFVEFKEFLKGLAS